MTQINALSNEIRRVDGGHSLGAGALAEALMPFLAQVQAEALREAAELPIPLGVMNVKSWLRDRAAMIEADSDR